MPIATDNQPIPTVTHLRDRECPSALVEQVPVAARGVHRPRVNANSGGHVTAPHDALRASRRSSSTGWARCRCGWRSPSCPRCSRSTLSASIKGHRRYLAPTPRYTSSCTMPGTCWDSPATSQSGRSERGGDSPEFFGHGGVRPGQRAQHHISRTRIQIALKLTPDRFR